ncbi:MAG: hypothetical protein GAK28_01933 [Luteibacter sp.]|uniref:hypothetical protein n=1 Tax=Luteibacter sp. TaxID=1886636 RepID=UPI00137EC99D|nr:hypothetical protein [Luteibacter sp.]KAF1007294.1 MAG: hypothetical protein GAK28_01933 [Luteibacter sp.]
MNAEYAALRKQVRDLQAIVDSHIGAYAVILADTGKWLHAPGSDYLFAYLDNSWSPDLVAKVTSAFETALKMSSTIKEAVKNTSGQSVVDGLYLLEQPAMTKAMNSIPGMGLTQVAQQHQSGEGTAVDINGQFFAAILGGLGGDVAPMLNYLTTTMGDIQAQTQKSTVTKDFGTIMGLISVMPVLNVPVTSFQYVYSTSSVSTWFVKVNCASVQKQSYDYGYTVCNYNYSP